MRPGFTVGAGVEYAFSNTLVARVEYLYIDIPEYDPRTWTTS